MDATWKVFFLLHHLLLLISLNFYTSSGSTDTINSIQSVGDGETIVSSGGMFELGFFSPGDSKNRYVGIWYYGISVQTIVWVANRESPLTNQAGVLKVTEPGVLVLVNGTGEAVWSSKISRSVQTPVAQLLDSGNLVLRDADANDEEDNYVWQSFDYPTDTYLASMKFGWNFVTGVDVYLKAWKAHDDPAPGEFTYRLELTGYPQIVLRRNASKLNRFGPWNGIYFSGFPDVRGNPTYTMVFVMDKNEVYYQENIIDKRAVVRRFTLDSSGVGQKFIWVNQTQQWEVYVNRPSDNCDSYDLCGVYGICSIQNSPACSCLDRFVPKDSEGWIKADWTSGCIRKANLSCQGDGFIKYSGIKLPDAQNSWTNESMTLGECEVECLKNCSCMAYTQLNISNGSGCILWFGELVDIRSLSVYGQDLYIRMASSEIGSRGMKRKILIASLTSMMGIILLGLSLILFTRKRNKVSMRGEEGKCNESKDKESELTFFKLAIILKATNGFTMENKLGEGGFGPVYKGVLEEGQEIAVKQLARTSMQGIDEFKNEVIFIAKLQHRNLVRLLGCCIEGDENLLIYEYMPNKSLDKILFDETTGDLLDWPTRFHIINGIARGLLYLHQDSRLRIIHRDLKASNILLDSDMNPKIPDFGMARSFGGNETEAKTSRVVGTYGYMSPE